MSIRTTSFLLDFACSMASKATADGSASCACLTILQPSFSEWMVSCSMAPALKVSHAAMTTVMLWSWTRLPTNIMTVGLSCSASHPSKSNSLIFSTSLMASLTDISTTCSRVKERSYFLPTRFSRTPALISSTTGYATSASRRMISSSSRISSRGSSLILFPESETMDEDGASGAFLPSFFSCFLSFSISFLESLGSSAGAGAGWGSGALSSGTVAVSEGAGGFSVVRTWGTGSGAGGFCSGSSGL